LLAEELEAEEAEEREWRRLCNRQSRVRGGRRKATAILRSTLQALVEDTVAEEQEGEEEVEKAGEDKNPDDTDSPWD